MFTTPRPESTHRIRAFARQFLGCRPFHSQCSSRVAARLLSFALFWLSASSFHHPSDVHCTVTPQVRVPLLSSFLCCHLVISPRTTKLCIRRLNASSRVTAACVKFTYRHLHRRHPRRPRLCRHHHAYAPQSHVALRTSRCLPHVLSTVPCTGCNCVRALTINGVL